MLPCPKGLRKPYGTARRLFYTVKFYRDFFVFQEPRFIRPVFCRISLVFDAAEGYNGSANTDKRGDGMKSEDITALSIHIVTEYYKNNLGPFLEAMGEDVLWLGPAQRQQIRGRTALERAFAEERHALTFTMGDLSALCVSPAPQVKEVLLHYDITTHYPSGHSDVHDQRVQMTWRERRSGGASRTEIVMIHISNAWQYDIRDNIYPVHYESVPQTGVSPAARSFVTVRAEDKSTRRIAADGIVYIEAVKHRAQILIHMAEETVTAYGTLSRFEAEYPALFLRVHEGFLVNPNRVRGVRRFFLTMSDGTDIPVPEKKYTRVKKMLMR